MINRIKLWWLRLQLPPDICKKHLVGMKTLIPDDFIGDSYECHLCEAERIEANIAKRKKLIARTDALMQRIEILRGK